VGDLDGGWERLRSQGGCYRLPDRTILRLTGEDRVRYLNGQVTNDLRRLAGGQAVQALVLTAKGKLCADVFVWTEGDALLVEADAALMETLPPRLERYAISDDVAFELVEPAPERWHVFGPASEAAGGLRIDRLGLRGVDAGRPPEGTPAVSDEKIELLRIAHGAPRWGCELDEDTLPHEAGLDRTAVDFNKGCYVGQEVVSRIQSVGRVNRVLAGFVGEFPATALKAKLQGTEGAAAGHLTSAAFAPMLGKTIALGYLSTRTEERRFTVIDESGACLGWAEWSQFPLFS